MNDHLTPALPKTKSRPDAKKRLELATTNVLRKLTDMNGTYSRDQ